MNKGLITVLSVSALVLSLGTAPLGHSQNHEPPDKSEYLDSPEKYQQLLLSQPDTLIVPDDTAPPADIQPTPHEVGHPQNEPDTPGSTPATETGQTQNGPVPTIPGIAIRLAGFTRYETARQIAQRAYPKGANTVFVVSGANPVDGIAASAGNGPILYGDPEKPAELIRQIQDFHPQKIVVIGKSVLPANLEAQQGDGHNDGFDESSKHTASDANTTGWEIRHIQSANRVQTANKLARELFPHGANQVVLVASGDKTPAPDALPAAGAANGAPILLVESTGIDRETLDTVKALNPRKILIAGGSKAVPSDTEEQLKTVVDTEVTRVGGADRIDTSIQLSNLVKHKKNIYLVRSDTYIDAIAGGTLHDGAVIYHHVNQPLSPAVTDIARQWGATSIVALGGTGGELDNNMVVFYDAPLAEAAKWQPPAHIELPVAYTSQFAPFSVPYGCELISLYMGLRSKGYAQNVTTEQFVAWRPTHPTNPDKGYAGNPFTKSEVIRNTIHPGPLTAYGQRFGNVVDLSGQPFSAVINEIQHGNPVVLFLTYGYAAPYWRVYNIEGTRRTLLRNNHVVLAAGWDEASQSILLADPYSRSGSPLLVWKSRASIESIYNARYHAVAVR